MNVEKFCTACNIKVDSNKYLTGRTVCKSCYEKNKRKKNNNALIGTEIITSHQQPKNDNVNNNNDNVNNPNLSTYENHAFVVFGTENVGKTYYMLRIQEKIGNQRPIHIETRSANQYPNYKTSNEIEPINKYKGSIIIFNDVLGGRNSSQLDEFYARGRHEGLSVFYVSQSYFWFTQTKHLK